MSGLHDRRVAVLALHKVGKSFAVDGKHLEALRDISLTVRQGEFISFIGASGCGKSTLLRLIVGLEADYDGEILLGGQPVRGPGLDRGIVFQDHRLFPWLTVKDNVALGLDASDVPPAEHAPRVRDHIDLVGLSGFENAFPHQLSGGMAQRAAIARALVTKPRILLLDEPLGALDSMTRARLQDELQRIWEKEHVTMVMVTHDVEEAVYLSDAIIVLEPRPGRIRSIVPVNLPRARNRLDPAFLAIKERILRDLGANRAS